MFTGIVRALAPVTAVTPHASGARIGVDLASLAAGVAHGDSVAVNGACLTAVELRGAVCGFDAVAETLSRTTLGSLRPGDQVNIEPSLRVGDQLGGHFVLGHVDGIGEITALPSAGEGAGLRVAVDADLAALMVPKGSVAVDGISLTIAELREDRFSVAVIPHTMEATTLKDKAVGSRVNIEADMIGKHVARLMGKTQLGDLTPDFLARHGFLE